MGDVDPWVAGLLLVMGVPLWGRRVPAWLARWCRVSTVAVTVARVAYVAVDAVQQLEHSYGHSVTVGVLKIASMVALDGAYIAGPFLVARLAQQRFSAIASDGSGADVASSSSDGGRMGLNLLDSGEVSGFELLRGSRTLRRLTMCFAALVAVLVLTPAVLLPSWSEWFLEVVSVAVGAVSLAGSVFVVIVVWSHAVRRAHVFRRRFLPPGLESGRSETPASPDAAARAYMAERAAARRLFDSASPLALLALAGAGAAGLDGLFFLYAKLFGIVPGGFLSAGSKALSFLAVAARLGYAALLLVAAGRAEDACTWATAAAVASCAADWPVEKRAALQQLVLANGITPRIGVAVSRVTTTRLVSGIAAAVLPAALRLGHP